LFAGLSTVDRLKRMIDVREFRPQQGAQGDDVGAGRRRRREVSAKVEEVVGCPAFGPTSDATNARLATN